jgi:hypothetical protein
MNVVTRALPFALALVACSKPTASTSTVTAGGADATALAPPPAPSAPANGTPLPSASVAAFVNPQNLPAYSGPTGSVEGTISITGDPSPDVPGDFTACPDAVKTYGKLFRAGNPVPGGGRALADAVIAITGYTGYYVPEANEVRKVSIEGCAFPRVIDMTIGQRLELVNNTTDVWGPILEQAVLPALMLAPPKGGTVKLFPPRPGHYSLADQLRHPYAKSDVWALMYPLHAVSNLEGHYRIDGVPVGKLQVSARLTMISEQTTKPVDVLAGVVQKVDLELHYTPKDAGADLDSGPPANKVFNK